MSIKDGGPAFPCEQGREPCGTWNQTFDSGMTLRDYFAAKAMQGIIIAAGDDLQRDPHQLVDPLKILVKSDFGSDGWTPELDRIGAQIRDALQMLEEGNE
jgi:hypothetical protein